MFSEHWNVNSLLDTNTTPHMFVAMEAEEDRVKLCSYALKNTSKEGMDDLKDFLVARKVFVHKMLTVQRMCEEENLGDLMEKYTEEMLPVYGRPKTVRKTGRRVFSDARMYLKEGYVSCEDMTLFMIKMLRKTCQPVLQQDEISQLIAHPFNLVKKLMSATPDKPVFGKWTDDCTVQFCIIKQTCMKMPPAPYMIDVLKANMLNFAAHVVMNLIRHSFKVMFDDGNVLRIYDRKMYQEAMTEMEKVLQASVLVSSPTTPGPNKDTVPVVIEMAATPAEPVTEGALKRKIGSGDNNMEVPATPNQLVKKAKIDASATPSPPMKPQQCLISPIMRPFEKSITPPFARSTEKQQGIIPNSIVPIDLALSPALKTLSPVTITAKWEALLKESNGATTSSDDLGKSIDPSVISTNAINETTLELQAMCDVSKEKQREEMIDMDISPGFNTPVAEKTSVTAVDESKQIPTTSVTTTAPIDDEVIIIDETIPMECDVSEEKQQDTALKTLSHIDVTEPLKTSDTNEPATPIAGSYGSSETPIDRCVTTINSEEPIEEKFSDAPAVIECIPKSSDASTLSSASSSQSDDPDIIIIEPTSCGLDNIGTINQSTKEQVTPKKDNRKKMNDLTITITASTGTEDDPIVLDSPTEKDAPNVFAIESDIDLKTESSSRSRASSTSSSIEILNESRRMSPVTIVDDDNVKRRQLMREIIQKAMNVVLPEEEATTTQENARLSTLPVIKPTDVSNDPPTPLSQSSSNIIRTAKPCDLNMFDRDHPESSKVDSLRTGAVTIDEDVNVMEPIQEVVKSPELTNVAEKEAQIETELSTTTPDDQELFAPPNPIHSKEPIEEKLSDAPSQSNTEDDPIVLDSASITGSLSTTTSESLSTSSSHIVAENEATSSHVNPLMPRAADAPSPTFPVIKPIDVSNDLPQTSLVSIDEDVIVIEPIQEVLETPEVVIVAEKKAISTHVNPLMPRSSDATLSTLPVRKPADVSDDPSPLLPQSSSDIIRTAQQYNLNLFDRDYPEKPYVEVLRTANVPEPYKSHFLRMVERNNHLRNQIEIATLTIALKLEHERRKLERKK